MEYSRFDPAESVITIRISLKEYEKVSQWVDEENAKTFRYRNKTTISKLVRQMIRYCLNWKDEINNIMTE